MVLLLVMGLALLLASIALLGAALRPHREALGIERSLAVLAALTHAPAELAREVDRPFVDRVSAPLQARALALGRRLVGSDSVDRLRHRLDLAGNPPGWDVDRVLTAKVLLGGAGLGAGLTLAVLLGLPLPLLLLAVLCSLALGFFGPGLWLYQRAYERSERIQRDLPDSVDLLAISVEAGLGFDAAMLQVAQHTEGPLAEEISRVLREMQLGQSRGAALRALADRTDVADLNTFVSAMVQSDRFGLPVGHVLRVQSEEMRTARRQRAEHKAQQVPVKITVPLIFCILPCLFVVVLGPAFLSIMDTF